MTKRVGWLGWIGLILIGGCSPRPVVRYLRAAPDTEGRIKYALTGSTILLTKDDHGGIKATAVPVESKYEMMIEPHEGWFVHTELAVSYVENTRIMKSIGTQVVDNRVKILQAVGETVAAAATFGILTFAAPAHGAPAALVLPVAIDPDLTWKSWGQPGSVPQWTDVPGNEANWQYSITLIHRPADVVPFDKAFAWETDEHVLPLSSCAKVELRVRKKPGSAKEGAPSESVYPLTIADPTYAQTVAFPRQGTISMHSLCGADVTSQPVDTTATWQLLSEAAKQAKAVQDAQEAAKQKKKGGTAN